MLSKPSLIPRLLSQKNREEPGYEASLNLVYSARLNFEFPNSDQCLKFMLPYFNFSQTQFPLAALLAGMAVHPETVAQPLGVSVTVDTSWEGLEDSVMVGGQSNKTNDSYCALKNSLHIAFTPSPSISLPLLILLHFILLSLSLPFFPLSHSFPSLFLLISPSPLLPHFFFFSLSCPHTHP